MRAVRAGGAAPEKCACRLDPLDREALTTAIEREVAVTFIEARPSTVVVTAQVDWPQPWGSCAADDRVENGDAGRRSAARALGEGRKRLRDIPWNLVGRSCD